MKDYSIVRIGNEYVVQAGEKSLLKIGSRRRAAKLVNDAAGLLEQVPAMPAADDPSIACDVSEISGPSKVP
jgi:hypothetical protein